MHLSSVKIPVNFGIDWSWSSNSFSILKPVFYQIYLRCFCKYLMRLSSVMKWDHRWRPIGFHGYWLYISFAINHRWTFRSIIDIAIDSIHIGGRIFSVNHSGVLCFQSWVHRDPHACATRYLVPRTGFQNIKTPGSSAETAGQNTGLLPDKRYIAMRNSSHFDLFSSEDRYIFCEWCHSVFYNLDSTSPSDERHRPQHSALTGRTADVTGRMWSASPGE